jgi:hypothetical protein
MPTPTVIHRPHIIQTYLQIKILLVIFELRSLRVLDEPIFSLLKMAGILK